MLAIRQEQGIQDIDRLCYTCHAHIPGIAVEDVECQCGCNGIAHRALLIQRRACIKRTAVPVSPLTDNQFTFSRCRPERPLRFRKCFKTVIYQAALLVNDIFQLFASIDHVIPLFFIELFLRLKLFQIPVVKMEIIAVKRWHTVFSHLLEKVFRPRNTLFWLVPIRTAGNAFRRKRLIARSKGWTGRCKFPIFIRIHLRRHFSAAIPYFISNAPVFYLKRRFVPVYLPLSGKCCGFSPVAILHPFTHFSRRTCHHIDIKPWLCADHFTEFHHLVRTELIRIGFKCTKIFIISNRPVLSWSDTVSPVVNIRIASARPADHRRMQLLKCIHKVFSDSMIIRNLRILTDPDTIVNTGAKEFNKVSLQLRVNIVLSD